MVVQSDLVVWCSNSFLRATDLLAVVVVGGQLMSRWMNSKPKDLRYVDFIWLNRANVWILL